MELSTMLGLERGIHTKDGKRITSHNAFIDSVVNACSANDFIIARAFSDSESFNPRLVLIGIQYDHTIQLPEGQNEYFVPKVGAILEQLITKNSIILGEGGARELTLKDRGLFDGRPFNRFVGNYPVRLIDNPDLMTAKIELELQGVDCWDACAEGNIKNYLAPEILRAVREPRDRVFCMLDGGYFVRNNKLLEALEASNVSYLLLCPRQVFLLKTAPKGSSPNDIRRIYYDRLVDIASDQYVTEHEMQIIDQALKEASKKE